MQMLVVIVVMDLMMTHLERVSAVKMMKQRETQIIHNSITSLIASRERYFRQHPKIVE